jgi:hypothetical protein
MWRVLPSRERYDSLSNDERDKYRLIAYQVSDNPSVYHVVKSRDSQVILDKEIPVAQLRELVDRMYGFA